ncbi:MAG: hypothetical protein K2K96_04845 [Lachnospiraceae bacterium]|nr:hypothetical protein [Lachnospiraceae bacterium]
MPEIEGGIFVVEVILISLLFLVMVPGLIIYDKQMEKYYKKHCTLKVEAHIVERKKVSATVLYGGHVELSDDFFRPVFAIDIEGTEYLIVEKKLVWTDRTLEVINGTEHLIAEREPTWIDRPLEEYPHLMLWVNPQNTKQFRYDDEGLGRAVSRSKKASYIFSGIACMLIAAIVFAFR